jgi:hypothetical protein
VAVDLATGTRRVLLGGLDKPTAVARSDGVLWIMIRRGLLRSDWATAGADASQPEVVLEDLAFNGRSEGTLTVLRDGRILYETTGTIDGDLVAAGSGILWVYDPATNQSEPIGLGLKNAYSHVEPHASRNGSDRLSSAAFDTAEEYQ